ncbi:hypothetical protein CPZ06_10210 [Lactobacillus acidophilus]|nr:hypothetical protein CPZ06_10210 [Lactobacillus acidophilus]
MPDALLDANVLQTVVVDDLELVRRVLRGEARFRVLLRRLTRLAELLDDARADIVLADRQAESRSGVLQLRGHVHRHRADHDATVLAQVRDRPAVLRACDVQPDQPFEVGVPGVDFAASLDVVDDVLGAGLVRKPELRFIVAERIGGAKNLRALVLGVLVRADIGQVDLAVRFPIEMQFGRLVDRRATSDGAIAEALAQRGGNVDPHLAHHIGGAVVAEHFPIGEFV